MSKVSHKSFHVTVLIKALLVSYIITAFLLLLIALIMFRFNPNSTVISVGIVITYIVSSFVGGFVIGTAKKEKRYLWGIGMGLLYYAIILVVALIFRKDVFGDVGSMISVLCMCGLGGMLGGMIS